MYGNRFCNTIYYRTTFCIAIVVDSEINEIVRFQVENLLFYSRKFLYFQFTKFRCQQFDFLDLKTNNKLNKNKIKNVKMKKMKDEK